VPNPRIEQILTSHRRDMYGLADNELGEVRHYVGLAADDVQRFLTRLQELEATWGEGGRALLLQEINRGTSNWDHLWAGLSAMIAEFMTKSVEGGWEIGVEVATEIAAHVGETVPHVSQIRSTVDVLRESVIPFADDATMLIENRVRGELVRGVLAGEDVATISRRLIGAGLDTQGTPWKTALARARATIRTETSRAYHTALLERFDKAEWITGYQWICFFRGEWPCSTCAPRHGRFYVKGATPMIPAHPNCACGLWPVTKAYGKHSI